MRGKLGYWAGADGGPRITPARAGKTPLAAGRHRGEQDHPRACGENLALPVTVMTAVGSPPRVRGKPCWSWARSGWTRITPARAGKTTRREGRTAKIKDHPRACGENLLQGLPSGTYLGSPPRVRGKRHRPGHQPGRRGITPARAGKTRRIRVHTTSRADHPRACGENTVLVLRDVHPLGSPPRVRGKPSCNFLALPTPRITPARAGKTAFSACSQIVHKDHPRACGENTRLTMPRFSTGGSPPRVRGKPVPLLLAFSQVRITPARAGKTVDGRSILTPH